MDINKMVKITWIVDDLEIPEWGYAVKGRKTEVPEDVAQSLVDQGIAKVSKKSKIKESEQVSDTGEE
jgi:hypothetical protein